MSTIRRHAAAPSTAQKKTTLNQEATAAAGAVSAGLTDFKKYGSNAPSGFQRAASPAGVRVVRGQRATAGATGVGGSLRGHEIKGVGRSMQTNPDWSALEYEFANTFWRKPYKGRSIGSVGCTMTALANGISGVIGRQVTPLELNKSNTLNFERNFGVKLELLHGDKLKPRDQIRIGVSFDSQGNITGDSNTGILEKTKASLRQGKPVILGLTTATGKAATGKQFDRHSVIAYGISASGKILVYDPAIATSGSSYTASARTLDDTMRTWGETHIDFANAIAKA
ncbi:MAG: hypothetical protein Q8N26_34785 [Myxococcales bacterium]|nr:hypothetical protein [Myxococcales bacterium]